MLHYLVSRWEGQNFVLWKTLCELMIHSFFHVYMMRSPRLTMVLTFKDFQELHIPSYRAHRLRADLLLKFWILWGIRMTSE